MTDINTLILQQRIRHAVDLTRYENGVVQDIIALLNDAERDLLAQLARRLEREATWTNARLKAIFVDMAQLNAANHKEAAKRLAAEMVEFASHEAEQTAHAIESVKPPTADLPAPLAKQIDLAFTMTLPTAEQLATIVSKEPITVGADGKLLLEEIFAKLAAGKEEKIRQAVRLGMSESETVDQIVRRLRGTRAARFTDGVFQANRRNTEAMVRTIVMHTSNRAAAATYQANTDVVKGMLRMETLDKSTCTFCGGIDGTTVPVGNTSIAPFHLNCRGFTTPVLKSWAEMGIPLREMPPSVRASMGGFVPESTDYPTWLKGYEKTHPGTAKEILGPARAELFLSGKLDIKDFTDDKGKVLNLKQLAEVRAKRQ